ncbi:hypothetical protein GCM10027037_32790 [Mucilaginibacter koreensis]
MLKSLFTLLFWGCFFVCNAQSNWIKEVTVPISADVAGQFTNLSVLREPLKGVTVVSLGEQTHFDGATFDAKVQLIKYLHEQLGFNVLAFESGFYDCSKASQLLAQHKTGGILKKAVFGIWDNASLTDLENYLLSTLATPHPLKVTGFDCQFSGQLSKQYLAEELTAYLQKINAQNILQNASWPAFTILLQQQIKYSNFYKKPSPADTLTLASMCRRIIKAAGNSAPAIQSESRYWQMVLMNIINDAHHRYADKNHRDSVMADNVFNIINLQYPNEKVICWNATSHIIYNPTQIKYKEFADFIPMGDRLHKKLNEQLYTIGFTSYEGKAGSLITHKLKRPAPDSYEYIAGQAPIDYAFTNLRQARKLLDSNETITCRMLGNVFMPMILPKVADGLFFIRKAYPPRAN